LIDDNSFSKLIPGWNIDMNKISDPIKSNMRDLGMTKLLYKYGGIRVPVSFLCMRNLIDMYDIGTNHNKMFICEMVDRNITSTHTGFYPNIQFMGSPKQNETVGELIEFMQRIISGDYTDQSIFLGDFNRWCEARIKKNQIKLIDGKMVGSKTVEDEPVIVDTLLSNSTIDFYSNMYGIYIPADEILNRRKYEWFARMSETQVLESRIILSKYILLASAPDAVHGVIEPMYTKNNWISFWKVPSNAPVWGLKPYGLGNNVLKEKYPGNYYN
jgi:hypothetical protein